MRYKQTQTHKRLFVCWEKGTSVHVTCLLQNGAGAVSNGPTLTHKKSKRKKKKVKGHHQGSSSMSLCPPSTSQQTHADVIEHGDDVLEVINVGKITSTEILSVVIINCVLCQRWVHHLL